MHIRRFALLVLIVTIASCSKSGGSGGGGAPATPTPIIGTQVTITFTGTLPNAAAVATGTTSLFSSTALSGNQLSFTVPAGFTTYAVALACPAATVAGTTVAEYVIEANLSDGTSYSMSPCVVNVAQTGAATGTFDISAVPGAARATIIGKYGFSGSVNATNASFSVAMPSGLDDVAIVARDAFGNVLAVKMLRAQTVPGVLNNGATIFAGVSDLVTRQQITVNGVPPGFNTVPTINVTYTTANRTIVPLTNGTLTSYPAIAPVDASALDQYQIGATASNPPTYDAMIGTSMFTPSGSAIRLTYPPSWFYNGPVPAQYPTFSFSYSGLNGSAALTYYTQLSWQSAAATTNSIAVFATPAYLGTLTTVTIPNLTSVPGFFGAAPSGQLVAWLAQIYGGSFFAYTYPPPSTATLSFVQESGTYTQP